MNTVISERFVENVQRLALGIEPIDAVRALRISRPIRIAIEPKPFPDPLPPATRRVLFGLLRQGRRLSDTMPDVERHVSCLHALLFRRALGTEIDLRLFEPGQRYVPRRLRVPLHPLANPGDPSLLDSIPIGERTRRPALFPGADYEVSGNATGIRGRVVRLDPADPTKRIAVRWPRIVARRNGNIIGLAHGDQHGEFLLLLSPRAVPEVQLPTVLTVEVTAFGSPMPPPPPPSPIDVLDPLWDLPIETLAAPGVLPDPIAAGQMVPANYTANSAPRAVGCTYGELVSAGIAPFEIA